MKRLSMLVFLTLALWNQAWTKSNDSDSLYLKIDKRNQELMGIKPGQQSLRRTLEAAFEKQGLSLSDSLWNEIRKGIRDESQKQELSLDLNGKKVRIALMEGQNFTAFKPNTSQGLSLKDGPSQVDIGLKGIHVKDGAEEVHIAWNGIQVKDGNEQTNILWGQDSSKVKAADRRFYQRRGFDVHFGFNALAGNLPTVYTLVYPSPLLPTDADLRGLKSNYIALEWKRSIPILKGKKTALHLGYGLGLDWSNYTFDHHRVLQNQGGQSVFYPVLDNNGREQSFKKNKLVTSYLMLPLMPHLVFDKKSTVQMIGIGGYVGYRMNAWTKTKQGTQKEVEKNSNNFNLNQLRYGLRAEFALRHFPDLFFQYDLNPLFIEGRGPTLNAFSFGICLL